MRFPVRSVSKLVGGLALVAAVAGTTQAQVIDYQAPTPNCYASACVANGFNFSFISGGWAITHDGNSFSTTTRPAASSAPSSPETARPRPR